MSHTNAARHASRPRVSSALLRAIEAMGIRGAEAHWKRVPADVASRLKPRTAHVADAFLTALEGSDSLRSNRVIGLGHRGRAREHDVESLFDFFRQAHVKRFSVSLGPGPQSREIASWLLARGLSPKPGLALLLRDARRPVATEARAVRVHRAAAVDRPTIVRIHAQCFGMPPGRRAWALAAAASREVENWLAFVGATPVGVGTLWVDGRLAWLGGGATLTRWRRRGAHRALIAVRLRRARSVGCRWAWVETAAPVRGRPDGSRRNLLSVGFEQVALKPLYVWETR